MDVKASVPRPMFIQEPVMIGGMPRKDHAKDGGMNSGTINRTLFELAEAQEISSSTVADVRIGLGYASVLLEGGRLGLSAVLRRDMEPGCNLVTRAGTMAGGPASELLKLLVQGETPLDKTIGLATANAILNSGAPSREDDTLELIGLSDKDRVTMVGFFGPLVERVKDTGARLSIVEIDRHRPGIHNSDDARTALERATVALITATSLLNDTLESILSRLPSARHVTLLGPSTPLAPKAFQGTPVNHLAGSVSMDNRKILQIVSEGGGTPIMRPWLRFVNIVWNKAP